MFSASRIKNYRKVYDGIVKTAIKITKSKASAHQSITPEELMLGLLKKYDSQKKSNTHKVLAKKLIDQLEQKSSQENSRLDNVFNDISTYIQSETVHLSLRDNFFSLLVFFFRRYPELIYKIKPDVHGVYALLLLGVFAYDKVDDGRDGLASFLNPQWYSKELLMKLFLTEVIPHFSQPLLQEFVKECIKDSYVYYGAKALKTPSINHIPLLRLLLESKVLESKTLERNVLLENLHKKVSETLSNCVNAFPEVYTTSVMPLSIGIEETEIVLSEYITNRMKKYDWQKINVNAIPIIFQALPDEAQKLFLCDLLSFYDQEHNRIIGDALSVIQYLFPQHNIFHKIIEIAKKDLRAYVSNVDNEISYDMSDRSKTPVMFYICSQMVLFKLKEHKKNQSQELINIKHILIFWMPKDIVNLISNYIPNDLETYLQYGLPPVQEKNETTLRCTFDILNKLKIEKPMEITSKVAFPASDPLASLDTMNEIKLTSKQKKNVSLLPKFQ